MGREGRVGRAFSDNARDGVYPLTHEYLRDAGEWDDLVHGPADHAVQVAAGMIVLDTLRRLAGMGEGAENDASAMSEVMRAPQEAAARGLAVLVLHHNRKNGGDYGEAASGSNTLVGQWDGVVDFRRDDGNRRRLEVIARWRNAPAPVTVEMVEDKYRVVGAAADSGAMKVAERRERIESNLLAHLENAPAGGVDAIWLQDAIVDLEGRPSVGAVKPVLRDLYAGERVRRAGRGVRGEGPR